MQVAIRGPQQKKKLGSTLTSCIALKEGGKKLSSSRFLACKDPLEILACSKKQKQCLKKRFRRPVLLQKEKSSANTLTSTNACSSNIFGTT